MNSMEEKLWNYIDGTCTPDERQVIAGLIANDEDHKLKYNELLKLNGEFTAMELDEPSMAFTYNVMEGIRREHALQPLKAAINKHIIWGIMAFFMVTICALTLLALSNVTWSGAKGGFKIPQQFNINHVLSFFSGTVVKGFLFFDVILGLFIVDHFLRRKLFKA